MKTMLPHLPNNAKIPFETTAPNYLPSFHFYKPAKHLEPHLSIRWSESYRHLNAEFQYTDY